MSGSNSGAPLGAFGTLGVPPRLISPYSVGKPSMNSPPSSIVTLLSPLSLSLSLSFSLFLFLLSPISLSPLPFACLSSPLSLSRPDRPSLSLRSARGLHYKLKGPTPRNVLQCILHAVRPAGEVVRACRRLRLTPF